MFRNSSGRLSPFIGGALLATSLFSTSALAQTLEVKAVPWRGDPAQQHPVYNGGSLVLHGVAVPAPGCSLVSATWDAGDGSAPTSLSVSNPRVLETSHVYVGANNQPFTATLSVTDSCGTTVVDTFRVVVVDPKALDVEVNMAIDRGLWNLHKRLNLSNIGGIPTGYWASQDTAAATSSALQAMEIHGHRATGNGAEDPYVDDVTRGLAHLMTELQTTAISVQAAGDPDSNGNGLGILPNSGSPIYVGGQVIDALVGSDAPNTVATTGPTGIIGRTYAEIVQDMVDMYAWGQSESSTARGGWRYSYNADSDNSAAQWMAIGGIAAERVFGTIIPQFVKDENLNFWLAYSQYRDGSLSGYDGHFGYTGPFANVDVQMMNTTPSGVVQLVMDDVPSNDPRANAAHAYMARNWTLLTNNDRIYGLLAAAKALRLSLPAVPVLSSGALSFDWYRAETALGAPVDGAARRLVTIQQGDGSWDGYWVIDDLATSWAVIILSSTIVQVGPVAVAKANPSTTAATFPVNFSGAFSYHPDPLRTIVNYEWDYDHDGVYDDTGISTVHAFAATGNYDVTLRVTDDTQPQPLQSTASVTVHITPPPFPPDSNPGGPYVFCQQFQPWILDGTGSSDPDGSVVLYEWDFSPQPLNLSFDDAFGPTVDVTAYFQTLQPGQYDAALRVTDDAGGTDVDFTTIRVLAPGDPCPGTPPVLNCPPNFTEIWSGGIAAGQTDPQHCGTATYTDTCVLGVNLSYADISIVPNTLQNPSAPEVVVTRRWSLSDGCGFSTSCDQTITLLSPGGQDGTLRLDVLPDRCPNAFWPTTSALKVTIPGTWVHAVSEIVPGSITIRRADGVGSALSLGQHTFGLSYADVARPCYDLDGPCQANGATGPDGLMDLTMTTPTRVARNLLDLRGLPDKTLVTIIVSGKFINGDSFSVTDWIQARR